MKPLSEAILNSQKSAIRKLFELLLKSSDGISFGIGQPDFTSPDFVNDEIIKALKEHKTQYAPALGLPTLRRVVAQKFQNENKIKLADTENIIITNGGSQALQLCFASLSNPGDEVILSSPNFLSYIYLASYYHLNLVEVPRLDNYAPDLEGIRKAVTPKTKFIIINSPNNPTGNVFTKKQMDELVQIVLENDLYLVSDEVYEKFLYENRKHISPASYDEMFERTLTLNALSKTFGATGLRLGYIAANQDIIKSLIKASKREVKIKIILDSNRDAFGYEKGGIPNREVASELIKKSNNKIKIRWYNTHGEQFHSKLSFIKNQNNQSKIILGSANLTKRNIDNYNFCN